MRTLKTVVLVGLLISSSKIFAQDVSLLEPKDSTKVEKYRYLIMYGETAGLFGDKVKVTVQLGQSLGFFANTKLAESNVLKDKEGNDIEFKSLVDAFNFVGQRGWEYMSQFYSSSGKDDVYRFVFRQKI